MKLWFYYAFCDNATLLDGIIAQTTGGIYSHVEGQFSCGDSFSASPRDGGTRWKKIDYKKENWKCIDIPLSEESERRIRTRCELTSSKKYAYCGAIFSISPLCLSLPDRTFCSRLWVTLLCDTLMYEFGIVLGDPCSYSPQKLYDELAKYFGE